MIIEFSIFMLILLSSYAISLLLFKISLKAVKDILARILIAFLAVILSIILSLIGINSYIQSNICKGVTGEFHEIIWFIPGILVALSCTMVLIKETHEN